MNLKILVLWLVTLAILPVFVRSNYWIHVMILAGIYGILAASWDLLVGYTGLLAFCPAAFYGIGAYTSGLLSKQGISPLLTIPAACLLAGLMGFCISMICGKIASYYLAIVTLGFGASVHIIILNWTEVTGGVLGVYGIPPLPGLPPSMYAKQLYFYIMVLVQGVMLLITYKLVKSDFGLRIKAIRDDELLAKSQGINTAACKSLIFIISAMFQGIAGAFFAHFQTVISPEMLDLSTTTLIASVTIIGGVGTVMGPAAIAFFLWTATEYFRVFSPYLRVFLTGVLLILTIKFFRAGIMPTLEKFYKKIQSPK